MEGQSYVGWVEARDPTLSDVAHHLVDHYKLPLENIISHLTIIEIILRMYVSINYYVRSLYKVKDYENHNPNRIEE